MNSVEIDGQISTKRPVHLAEAESEQNELTNSVAFSQVSKQAKERSSIVDGSDSFSKVNSNVAVSTTNEVINDNDFRDSDGAAKVLDQDKTSFKPKTTSQSESSLSKVDSEITLFQSCHEVETSDAAANFRSCLDSMNTQDQVAVMSSASDVCKNCDFVTSEFSQQNQHDRKEGIKIVTCSNCEELESKSVADYYDCFQDELANESSCVCNIVSRNRHVDGSQNSTLFESRNHFKLSKKSSELFQVIRHYRLSPARNLPPQLNVFIK